ncbi:helix-turn-helix transcriptional regulator [Massilimaliae timonensis]|uniref:Helix-turn-helix transcriptional regulator n=1 Tax=Massiliimalia timonensis TaxID=1987501 RepID=A0A8J6PHW3_9FIRM|nr:helix-turn-helix transcriptional regulator [Massiliimalia timonensis]MBC8610340.1 helix-turn-helix transcriptional regulator [Massiliimalia timonensis]
MQLNENISRYIKSHGIKQSYISEKTGLSRDTVCKILNNKRKISGDELFLICDAIKVDPKKFWGQEK